MREVVPAETVGEFPVLNGREINVRKTHPNLYRAVMLSSIECVLLGLNFLLLNPTFLIYGQSNDLWGGSFLALGVATICFLNCFRSLRLMRLAMAATVSYILFLGIGTMQPWLEGEGSLQLPLLYAGWAVVLLTLLLEPFINPWTAKRGD